MEHISFFTCGSISEGFLEWNAREKVQKQTSKLLKIDDFFCR